MSLLLTKASVTASPWLLDAALKVVCQDSDFLRSSYPHFDKWFASKVLPGIYAGERTLLVEERESTAVGLLILKHSATEKKLCTLRVRPHFESRGLGVRLFETAFQILGTDRPLLSVSEPAAPKFERLFRYFGFAQEAVYQGRYLPMVDELAYNGLLDPGPVFQGRVETQHPRLPQLSTSRGMVRRHHAACRGPVCVCPA
jgi:GNAT superfamily N-acetyltransferase